MDFHRFRAARFQFHYRAEETVRMSGYKGNTLRGGFGAALKRVACNVKHGDCKECMLKDNCAYFQIFETPVPRDSKYFEGQTFAPHPFVLEPPLDQAWEYHPGEQIIFHLILIGRAIEFLPYFVLAFHILGQWGLGDRIQGRRGECFLEKIESIDVNGASSAVYLGENTTLSDQYHLIAVKDMLKAHTGISGNSVSLEFLTPTRIKSGGRLQDSIDFEMLVRALLRRVTTISYFHCGQELDLDYKGIVQRARENVRKTGEESYWEDWSRYSRRQRARMSLGGFKGEVTFEGELEEFIPLLLVGEYIHVGKNTAFGLGKYVIKA